MSDTESGTRPQRPANKRGAARLAAVQALYQMDLTGAGLSEIVAEYESLRLGKEIDGEQYAEADPAWFRAVMAGVVAGQKRIDPDIQAALPANWPLARIDTLLRAVLRAGVYELSERKDVPARAIITEYVDIAHAFFSGEEPGLVNGVLDRIGRRLRGDELAPPRQADKGAASE
jgi:transcription antitermination protein NusB